MPQLDVSDAFLEPTFLDLFVVIRRAETITDKGRSSRGKNTYYNKRGTVMPVSPNDLERGPDEQHTPKTVSIVTKFRLRGESEARGQNYQPDIVKWHDDYYLVTQVDDYSGFGRGFVQATAHSTDFVDEAPT